MDPGTIVSVISTVAEYTVAPIVKQVKYVLDYKENMTNLPKEVQTLKDLKEEVEGLVSSALMNAEAIKPSVEAWMTDADEIAEAARQMIREEEEESKKRCFIGLCPNPFSRRRSSRKAVKQTVTITGVQTKGREFKEGSVSFQVSAVPSFPVTVTLGKDFLDFNSRSKTWEDIMKALKDPGANVIGVYGMGGLGKTTLVKQVAARAAEEKLFDEVVVPVVTEKNVLDAREFQDEMAKVLNMKMDDQWNVSQRADRIRKRLTSDEKKTIVILDDLRAKLNLEQVGVPFGDGVKGCKILFTSRFQYISYAAQKTITLGVLEEEEAWALFQKSVGQVLKEPAFFNKGKEVTKNCKGLPILIVTVAGALLSRRSLGAWNDALLRLQREESEEMQEFVDSALEYISFNHLPDANKSLFLLCGMLGGGEISIFDQLLKLGIDWGLFKHTKTMEEARNNLETLILDLKASFLLFDGQSVDTIRMHDVVRDVAIKIASSEGHNMLLGSSDNWPEDDVLRRCTALTFPYGIVPELPECLDSPSLEFLLLYHNHSFLKITDDIFEKMQKLTILDIRSVDLFPKLPSSLALLENLHTLSLNLCKLGDISIVGALKKLKILSLSGTGVENLPMEVGNLSELRILDLNGCSELKVVPPGVIKRLTRLEELHMAKSFSGWEVEGLASSERRNASLNELKYLPKLTTLRIHVPDAKLLPKDFYFEKLERFTILIGGEEWDWACHDEKSLYTFRGIKIKVNGSMDSHLEGVLKEMLKRTEILYLDGMKNIHELEWKSFEELKFVHIQHSAETRYIVNAVESFPAGLESLFLSHLPQLQNLCRGMFMAESSFSKLKCVNVDSCNSLRNLFSFPMARCLPHLEEVKVTDCDSLEEIVEDTREEGTVMNKLEFRQLRSLILERLPKVASFCNSGTNRQKLVSTDEISSEDGCTIVAPFFSDKVLFPKLKELTLKECGSMEYLFSQSIVMGLEQLQFIEIDGCNSLKGIVANVEGEETNETIEFPQLVKLFLGVLPCLTRFCSGHSIVFPTLTVLWIVECQKIKTFVWEDKTMTNKKLSTAMQALFNEKVGLPSLKSLVLWDLDNVETIWHNRLYEDSFFKLERVDISSCPNLLTIFPCTMLGRIQNLEDLRVWSNCSVEEVFENNEMAKPNISQEEKTKFTQLRRLELSSLPKLKRFCSGSCVVFPALTQLRIWSCQQMETFMHRTIAGKGVADMGSSDMHPLFNEKVEFPSLKELHVSWLDSIMSIWDNRGTEEVTISFRNLRKAEVLHCKTLEYLFPSFVAQQLYHLEELRISDCGMETIVCQKEEEVKEEAITFVFPRLVTLGLEGLPKLESFYPGRHTIQWSSLKELLLEGMFPSDLVTFADYGGGSFLIPILEKIESLQVKHCPGLASFGQGSVSFEFLTELQVSECDGLVNLVQFSTAKSLVQLRTLKVFGCERMKEIVTSESAEGAEDEIVFSNLKALELVELPSVVNFYHGNCVLKFPLLEQVTVLRCDNMETFCGGTTITPKLKILSFTEDYVDFEEAEWREEDKNLNTIIKETYRLTTEKNATSPSEHLSEANDDICENSKEAGTNNGIVAETCIVTDRRGESCEDALECSEEVAEKNDKAVESTVKSDESNTCKEMAKTRNGGETLLRPYLVKGSLAPTPVDVTCPSSQSLPTLDIATGATTCQQKDDFEGLQVTQHLVPLLEKARDMHGDFHTSPWIKSKAVRITAMESVGQVLRVLQTQTPRTIDAENIQFMEDAFNDLCIMTFPVEWLCPLIREANKWLQRKAKIEEMEAQLQALKREMEMDKALDQPLLDM